MRNLASKKYGLDMLEPHLPNAKLEQVLGGRERGKDGRSESVEWSENREEGRGMTVLKGLIIFRVLMCWRS